MFDTQFFVYWFFSEVCFRLGETARIEPYLAAWAPNLFFGALGSIGYITVR